MIEIDDDRSGVCNRFLLFIIAAKKINGSPHESLMQV